MRAGLPFGTSSQPIRATIGAGLKQPSRAYWPACWSMSGGSGSRHHTPSRMWIGAQGGPRSGRDQFIEMISKVGNWLGSRSAPIRTPTKYLFPKSFQWLRLQPGWGPSWVLYHIIDQDEVGAAPGQHAIISNNSRQ